MLKPSFAAAATAVLVTLAGGLFVAGDAHARAIYKGTFDPRGDVYGFAGTYQFAVDPNCLATNGFKQVNVSGGCGDVFLIGGTLTLRKYLAANTGIDGPRAIPDKTFQFSEAQNDWDPALVWGPGPGEVGAMQRYISGINVVGNELFGVDTPARFGAFGPFDAISEPSGMRDLYWGLRFFSGATGDRGVELLLDCQPPFTPNSAVCNGNASTNPAFAVPLSTTVTFERVPEPGSLALVAVALIAAGLSWRRSRGG